MRGPIVLCLFLFCFSAWTQQFETQPPLFSGYITRAASGSDFDVNGVRVLCGTKTQIALPGSGDASLVHVGCFQSSPLIGQQVTVYGGWNRYHHTASANRIIVERRRQEEVSGFALVDAAGGTSSGAPGATEIRADGYRMLITPQTHMTFQRPLRGIQDVMTNVWVQYNGNTQPNGLLVLRKARFQQNVITDHEEALRTKTEYDPTAVPPSAEPDRIRAIDPKRIPPWPNHEEQTRIESIGQKLVPAWENNLAPSDPSRIAFRFQLTDGKRWPYVMALPSGIILVPHEVVERMENDSQLAAVLADSIACVLEKQSFRMAKPNHAIRNGAIVSLVLFGPIMGGGIAGVEGWAGHSVVTNKEVQQSERVSLDLMHDAGYDVDEAPKAWWLLASKEAKPIDQIAIPDRAIDLYQILGQLWSGQS